MRQAEPSRYQWFEPVALLYVSARIKFEEAGIRFRLETGRPLSTEAGPVSSAGVRLDDGSEYWLVAEEAWSNGSFLPERSHDPGMKLEVRAAPEQFDQPDAAVVALRKELELNDEEMEWRRTEWPDDVLTELQRRRSSGRPTQPG